MRKLASIRKISDIKPIDGADNIERAIVDGWEVVVKKGEYMPGDLTVYIEIDSLLPAIPCFEFMKDRKYKVKTAKIRGVYSQGLCVPLSILPSGTDIKEGQDVTDILHIRKFEIDDDLEDSKNPSFFKKMFNKIFKIKNNKYGKVGFPKWIEKTDQERIQNKKSAIDVTKKWIVSEKLDGTSATYAIKKHKVMFLFDRYEYFVCSRNLRISERDRTSKYVKVMEKYNIKSILKDIAIKNNADSVIIQGEIVGEKIQGNKYNKGLEFYVFDLKIDNVRRNIVITKTPLRTVPILHVQHTFKSFEDVLKMSSMKSCINPYTIAEGIVIRNVMNLNESYKCINPEFLVKNNI